MWWVSSVLSEWTRAAAFFSLIGLLSFPAVSGHPRQTSGFPKYSSISAPTKLNFFLIEGI